MGSTAVRAQVNRPRGRGRAGEVRGTLLGKACGLFSSVALLGACAASSIDRVTAQYDAVEHQISLGDAKDHVLSILEPTQEALPRNARKKPDPLPQGRRPRGDLLYADQPPAGRHHHRRRVHALHLQRRQAGRYRLAPHRRHQEPGPGQTAPGPAPRIWTQKDHYLLTTGTRASPRWQTAPGRPENRPGPCR